MDLSWLNPWLRRRGILLVPAPPEQIMMGQAFDALSVYECGYIGVECTSRRCKHEKSCRVTADWLAEVMAADRAAQR